MNAYSSHVTKNVKSLWGSKPQRVYGKKEKQPVASGYWLGPELLKNIFANYPQPYILIKNYSMINISANFKFIFVLLCCSVFVLGITENGVSLMQTRLCPYNMLHNIWEEHEVFDGFILKMQSSDITDVQTVVSCLQEGKPWNYYNNSKQQRW